MSFSVPQLIGLVISIFGIAGLAVWSGTRPQTFDNVNGPGIISGIIMGTLVGGSATVGTAQLAYTYGLSAWWFTLGGGIGCLMLALFYCKPLRRSGCMTLVGIISREYGPGAGLAASLLSCAGTFINIISQLIAGTAVVSVVLPGLSLIPSLLITAGFMALYVIFGGTQGAGRVGILKLALLYVSMLGCGAMVLFLTGGLSGFRSLVSSIRNPEQIHFFSLLARGAGKDIGACLSLVLGILTTQTYAQAVMSGRSDRAARTGALVSAVLVPPIGAGGILVGLYMRATAPGIAAKTALTAFATQHLPGLLSGLVLGTLFVAVVGTGAGLSMGISTIIRRDIILRYSDRMTDPKRNTQLSRLIIVAVLAAGCFLSAGPLGDTILNFAFMSMGLRGAVVFVPMTFALRLPGRVNRRWAMAGIIAGPISVLLFGTLLPLPADIDPLFAGVAASLLCCMIGLAVGRRKQHVRLLHPAHPAAEHLIIAIDSDLHAGARTIAAALGRLIGIPCYGSEILTEASAISGISEKLLRWHDGHPIISAYDVNANDESSVLTPPAEQFVRAQIDACHALAQKGPCILLDRFATAAFQNDPNCIRIRITAGFEDRAEVYASQNRVGPAAARRALRKADHVKTQYYKSANPRWGAAELYTIIVDTTGQDPNQLAQDLFEQVRTAEDLCQAEA